MNLIFKICPRDLWQAAETAGCFTGAPIDLEDGFIHFSDADQVRETAKLHFADQDNLMLVAVDAKMLGDRLRFESSRGGALFPHLYDTLNMTEIIWAKPLPLGADGAHAFPELAT